MEKIVFENMERQIAEMWDAISQIPAGDPDKQAAFDQAAKSENSLREAYLKQEALRDMAPELLRSLKDLVFYAKHKAPDPFLSSGLNDAYETIKKAEGRE